MPHPASDGSTPVIRASRAPVAIRIVLAVLLLIPGAFGLAAFCYPLSEWLSGGFAFGGSDLWLMPIIIIASMCLVSFSTISTGIVLRFARWRKAPSASLVLCLVSSATIVLGHQLLLDCFGPEDGENGSLSFVASSLGLVVVSLPPLLHWFSDGKRTGKPTN